MFLVYNHENMKTFYKRKSAEFQRNFKVLYLAKKKKND